MTRPKIRAKTKVTGTAVVLLASAALTLTAITQLLPTLLADPGYTVPPVDPCNAVQRTTLGRAFGTSKLLSDQRGDGERSSTCVWRPLGSEEGRVASLTAGVVVETTDGRPDPTSTEEAFHRFRNQPGTTPVRGLGEQAARNGDSDRARLVATSANLTVDVEYSATDQEGNPLPAAELDAVARQAAQDILSKTGPPS